MRYYLRNPRTTGYRLRQIVGALAVVAVLWGCGRDGPGAVGPAVPAPAPAVPGPPGPEAAVRWVRENAIPLSAESLTEEELDRFGQVAQARVIAVGEATHGTREFFEIRQQLLQYLVNHRGFRKLVIEADGGSTCDLDAYIQTGRGDPVELIHQMGFWTWRTQELLDIVRWMRSHNASVEDGGRVSLQGLDMQNPPALAKRVLSFLRTADPEAGRRAELLYRCLGPLDDREAMARDYPQAEVGAQLQCAAGLAEVHELLRENHAPFEKQNATGYACALWSSELMISAEALLRFPSTRDRYYAEAVQSLLSAPGPKAGVMIWAHNGHISNSPGSMGRRLKRQLGDDYLVIGQTFHEGSFRAKQRSAGGTPGPVVRIVAPSPFPDSYEALFQRTGLGRFLLDLRPLRADGRNDWLEGPHPLWDIGGTFRPETNNVPVRIAQEYDLFVFVSQARSSTPLPERQIR